MLNFALVGCGNMAHWHAQQLQKISDVNVVALADPVCHQTGEFKHKYFNHAAEYESYEALTENPPDRLDGVVLVTPHSAHYPQTKTALERGINVLVEKPMVTNRAQAEDLAQIVRRTGKLLAIGFQAPYTQEYQCL